MSLSTKQKAKLNLALAEYLHHSGYPEVSEAFVAAAGVSYTPKAKYTASLERKWTSLLKLTKKIKILQGQLDEANALLALAPVRKASDTGGYLPKTSPEFTLTRHRDEVRALAFHPSESAVVSGSYDGTLRFTDFETGETLGSKPLRDSGPVSAVAFSPDGSLLASAAVSSIRIWDYAARKRVKILSGHEADVSAVAFVGDAANRLLSASRDSTLKLWDLDTGFCLKTLHGHSDWARCLSVSPDGSLFASGSSDHSVCIWTADDDMPRAVIDRHQHVVEAVAFAPPAAARFLAAQAGAAQGSDTDIAEDTPLYIASAGRDNLIHIHTAAGAHVMELAGHDGWVRDLAWHPCGEYLLSVSDDKSLRVWSLASASELKVYPNAHTSFVSSLAFNTATPVVATGSVAGDLSIWFCT